MALKVLGAGLPRTGTTSLKAALERLTGEPCYHMIEFFPRAEDHGKLWWKAIHGDLSGISTILEGFGSAVDWPASLFWRDLIQMHPEAVVIMTHRTDAAAWWKSVDRTVWYSMRHQDGNPQWIAFEKLMRKKAGFGDNWDDPAAAQARYEELLVEVAESVPPERLLMFQPGDGWEPLCAALNVDVPNEPFPHLNDTAEFRAFAGWTD